MSRNMDRNQAAALSLHPWNNTAEDWQNLADVVYRLGRAAPKAARDLLAVRRKRQEALPNPFSN